VFDTSKKRGRPYTFTIGEGRVIKGWDQGVPGMKVGGKRRLTVPAELAYGPRAKGKIPANSQLTFTIELIEVVPPLPDPKGDEVFAGEPVQRTELEGGLVIEDFAVGEGRAAAAGDNIAVHYTGKLDDGTVFDSSVPRKKALAFVLGQGRVIKGWDQGIEGMKVGGLRRLIIPAELAYGSRGKGKIPADSRLTFTVELMSVRDAPPQPQRPAPRPR
jgi:peptidylprolyl isomerase